MGREAAWAADRRPERQRRPGRARPRRISANDPNLKTESLGTRSFDGVMAEGRRTTMTIPAGRMGNDLPIQIVTETWYSSELQATLYQKRTDPRNGEDGDPIHQHQPRRAFPHAVRRARRITR